MFQCGTNARTIIPSYSDPIDEKVILTCHNVTNDETTLWKNDFEHHKLFTTKLDVMCESKMRLYCIYFFYIAYIAHIDYLI